MKIIISNKIKVLIFLASITFIIIGISHGEFNDVYQKARLICLDCIGIG